MTCWPRWWCRSAQGHDAVDPAVLDRQIHHFRSAALIGASQTAPRSGALMKKHNALARRLPGRQDDYLRFTTGFRIAPGNNGTERDIRMAELKQKVSGCMRTLTGASEPFRRASAPQSSVKTAARQSRSI